MKLSTFFLLFLAYSAFANFGNHTPFLKSDGTVWATGHNANGELGDGTTGTDRLYPVQVTDSTTNPITNISSISSGAAQTIFLKSDGTVWATGNNSDGELGIGNTTQQNRAIQVTDYTTNPITNISAISSGLNHTVFLKNDGTVWATGDNSSGQLGDGSTTDKLRAENVTDSSGNFITNVSAIAAGYNHTVMLKSDGTVWATGDNSSGQLGDGTTTNKSRAVQVSDSTTNPITNVSAIAAGANHTVFLKNDGTVWATGHNGNGELGIGNTTQQNRAVQVTDNTGYISSVAAIAAGTNHTLFLKSDGTVWATGDNGSGELGDGSTTYNPRAEQVTDDSTNAITNISAISTGYNHSVFLKNDGTVWATGQNNNGELGDGSTTDKTRAVQVMQSLGNPFTNVSKLSGNSTHSINTSPTNLNPLTTLTLSENQPIGTVVGDFNATDPDYGAVLSYTLMNDNATSNSKFSISTAGRLTTAEVLDFENNASHTIRVLVSDELNATMEGNFTVTVTNVEEVPIITFGGGAATATSNVSENQRGAASIAATEPDGQTLTYSITGGVDAALFAIDTATGELSFISNPDYEFPNDSDQNNSYEVTIQVVDTVNNIVSQSITVVVGNMIDLSTAIFTNAGATGRYGPTQAQVNAAYTGTDLDGRVTINTQGIQEWTVPFSGIYSIEAWGAQGGSVGGKNGGLGAKMKGEFQLAQGMKIKIVVGQHGIAHGNGAGGGGGSFVVELNASNDNVPMIIAGGGGGATSYNSGSIDGFHGLTTQNGGTSSIANSTYGDGNNIAPGVGGGIHGNGGTLGYGGGGGCASGGAGFYGNGGGGYHDATPGLSFLNGATGGYGSGSLGQANIEHGGFGGGGAGSYSNGYGGGGGGYSGGGGGTWDSSTTGNGGGGGSYNLGTNQLNQAGANAGHGKVIISALNTPPSDITLSDHNISENLPTRSIVGTFSTTDPDDINATGSYIYQLIIDPTKPTPPLKLDSNGTLTTSSILDFETTENYSIRVKTSDSNGASFEKNFVVYVVDEFPPYVETGNANLSSDGRYTLYGMVVDEGGISGILERGFVISPKPISTLVDAGITKVLSTVNDNNFTASFTPSLAGKKHFFRAYAISAESDFLGTEETFIPAAIPSPGYWSDAKPSGAGADWWESSWFGSYYAPDTNQWIMHSELGWLFPSPSMDSGVWFWKDGLKWLWTDQQTFPFLHSIDQGSWLYFYGNVGEKRLFYAYASQKWIVLENGVIQEKTTYSQKTDDTGQANNPDLTGQQAGTPTGDPK